MTGNKKYPLKIQKSLSNEAYLKISESLAVKEVFWKENKIQKDEYCNEVLGARNYQQFILSIYDEIDTRRINNTNWKQAINYIEGFQYGKESYQ